MRCSTGRGPGGAALRVLLLLVLGLAWGGAAVPAAGARDKPPLHAGAPPPFTADMAISLDAEGRPALSTAVSISYRDLQWFRLGRGYGAGLEIGVSIDPVRRGQRVYGAVWERTLAVPGFEGTVDPAAAVVETRTFQVPPGRYRVRVTVRDLSAGLSSSAEETIEVPDYSRVPLGLSDLDLGVQDSAGRFTVVSNRVFGREVDRLAARVALFDRRDGSWPRRYALRWRLLDDQGTVLASGQDTVLVRRSAEPVVVRPPRRDLFLGTYELELELREADSHWRVTRSFDVLESGAPRGRDFTRALELLSYIAEPGEIDHLKALPPGKQEEGWDEFWRRRDPEPGSGPNPALVEFYRRVHYTEHHFQGFGPGWRSDMGRIYIKYGPPAQVESQSESNGTGTLEIWTYERPLRRFVFEDRDGFGRYVLVSPAFE